MKFTALLLRASVPVTFVLLSQPAFAQGAGGCSLLKAADLTALLGGPAVAKPVGTGCKWTAGSKKLYLIKMKVSGPAAQMAFAGSRNAASEGGTVKVTDESGIGDKAFSVLPSFGVAMIVMKTGRLFQLQYWTGATGTASDLAALRPVAKKAVAAF